MKSGAFAARNSSGALNPTQDVNLIWRGPVPESNPPSALEPTAQEMAEAREALEGAAGLAHRVLGRLRGDLKALIAMADTDAAVGPFLPAVEEMRREDKARLLRQMVATSLAYDERLDSVSAAVDGTLVELRSAVAAIAGQAEAA